MFKEGLLGGKRILITGGGTGLGKEIAARYAALGAEVWIAGRRGGVLEAAAKALGGNVRTHAVDIRDAYTGGLTAATQDSVYVPDQNGTRFLVRGPEERSPEVFLVLNALAPAK